jgi:hypothetical protein
LGISKKENFKKYRGVFNENKKPEGQPYFGWLSNTLPTYPETLSLETSVVFQEDGFRPSIVLDHENKHPLCHEQHAGITIERAHNLVDMVLGRTKK